MFLNSESEGKASLSKVRISFFVLLMVLPAFGSDKGDPRQEVLDASHLTRLNDVDMKPWQLKVNFRLSDRGGQLSEIGSIEEWWGGLTTWKVRIDSPSYSATVIENKDGNFRTEGVGPIPLRIREIEQEIVYPMPMGEDLGKTVPHMSHHKLEKVTLNCVQLSEPPIPVQSATWCFDEGTGSLHAIISANASILIRERVIQFEGHAPAMSIRLEEGKKTTASAEVVDLSPLQPDQTTFTPSADMKRVTDLHTVRITRTP